MERPYKISIIIILILGIGLFLSTGCGAREKAQTIRLGYLNNDLHQLAAFVALDQGLYKEAGLDVKVAGVFNSGSDEMTAFAAHSLDIGYVGIAPAINAVVNNNVSIKALALVNSEGSAIVTGRQKPINSISELKGKTVAVPGFGNVQDVLLRRSILNADLGLNDVKVIVLKPPEMLQTLERGDIDACVAWEPYPTMAISKGIGNILLDSNEIWPNHPCCILIGQEDFLREFPQTVKSLVQVHEKATAYIKQYPDEAVKIGVKYSGLDPDIVKDAINHIEYQTMIKPEEITEYLNTLNELGTITALDNVKFINDFIFTGK